MPNVISFTISDHEMSALEAASRRDGIDLLKEASNLFLLGVRAYQLLQAKSGLNDANALEAVLTNEVSRESLLEAFEANGAAQNAALFANCVGSSDFKARFRSHVKANQDRAQARPI